MANAFLLGLLPDALVGGAERSFDGTGDRPDRAFIWLVGSFSLVVIVGAGRGVETVELD